MRRCSAKPIGKPAVILLFAWLALAGCLPKSMVKAPGARAAAPGSREAAVVSPTPAVTPGFPQAQGYQGDKPVTLKAKRLKYLARTRQTEFLGGVRVQQGSTVLTADELTTESKGQEAKVHGNVRLEDTERKVLLTADQATYTNSLREAHLSEHVVVRSVDPYAQPVTLTSRMADYFADDKRAVLKGGVRLERRDVTATAGEAQYLQGEGLVTLIDQAEIERGINHFWADRIQFFQKSSVIKMDGGVQASFIPSQIQKMAEER